jgi:hypothetical protein
MNWPAMRQLYLLHAPFRFAIAGRHLNVMKLLTPHYNVDEAGRGDMTPLAEAARQELSRASKKY